MAKIITYTSGFDPQPLVASLPGAERISVGTRHDLAARIVDESMVCAVIVQVQRLDDEMRLFLSALKTHFPLLEAVAVTSEPPARSARGDRAGGPE